MSCEPQEESWPKWLLEHSGEKFGLAFYNISCPRCRAPAGQYCGWKANSPNTLNGHRSQLCEVRVRVWEVMGKPNNFAKVDLLVLKMIEATLEP